MLLFATALRAADPVSGTFKLKDGSEVSGRIFSVNNSGIIFKPTDGGSLSTRIAYKEFSMDALKDLVKDAKVARYAANLLPREAAASAGITLPPPPSREKLEPPTFTDVEDKPQLPEPRGIMGAIFGTKQGLLLLLLIWAGNLWAAHFIGIYRKQTKFLVPGIAAVAPIIAPTVFLFMKPKKASKKDGGGDDDDEEDEKPAKKKNSAAAAVAKPAAKKKVVTARPAAQAQPAAAPAAQAAAPIAAPAAPAAAGPKGLEAEAYVKGQVNINKRFIETKFAPFFKLVVDEPYRSAWLCFVTPRGEHWAKRIPSISPTDITLQCPQEGGGTLDTTLQLAEIQEIHLRPAE